MTARRFSLSLIAIAATLFVGTAAMNVMLDPEGVFGTGIFSAAVLRNERYLNVVRYRQAAPNVDGLIFGSSRAAAFDPELMRRYEKLDGDVLNFGVPFGAITDHLPLFEYILRDKAQRGERIKAVELFLDLDLFGKQPMTNVNVDAVLPPELSGETPARFWWRYLTAFQFEAWRSQIRAARTPVRKAEARARAGGVSARPDATSLVILANDSKTVAAPAPPVFNEGIFDSGRFAVTALRPDLDRQLALLTKFVRLCREHDIVLRVAANPMRQVIWDDQDPQLLDEILGRLNGVTPLWDFASYDAIAMRDELWVDRLHFTAAVADMMMKRIYTGTTDLGAADFGRLLPQKAQ